MEHWLSAQRRQADHLDPETHCTAFPMLVHTVQWCKHLSKRDLRVLAIRIDLLWVCLFGAG